MNSDSGIYTQCDFWTSNLTSVVANLAFLDLKAIMETLLSDACWNTEIESRDLILKANYDA